MAVKLTKRQTEVLHWIQQGLTNKHIAKRLNISESTVKLHITEVLKKYGARTRTQLAMSSTQGQTIVMQPIQLDLEPAPTAWYNASESALSFKKQTSNNWQPLYLKA